jgi:hypothetical protein
VVIALLGCPFETAGTSLVSVADVALDEDR